MRELSLEDPTILNRQRSQELLMFYDDFLDLQDSCSFFCDAVMCLLEVEAALDPSTMEGVRSYSDRIKRLGGELKGRLELIREEKI